jgi:hypothetical protein
VRGNAGVLQDFFGLSLWLNRDDLDTNRHRSLTFTALDMFSKVGTKKKAANSAVAMKNSILFYIFASQSEASHKPTRIALKITIAVRRPDLEDGFRKLQQ